MNPARCLVYDVSCMVYKKKEKNLFIARIMICRYICLVLLVGYQNNKK